MNRILLRGAASMAAALVGLSPMVAAAQEVSFAGKRIEMISPFAPGGGSDTYTRAVVPYFERYLPGNPSIIVRNIPGGGSIPGANQFQARAKPDGLHAISVSASTVANFVFRRSEVEFELDKWEPVLLSPQGSIVYLATGLVEETKDIAKLKDRQLIFGGNSPTGGELRVITSFELLGLNVKPVWGMGGGPSRLAFERGEITINHQATSAYVKHVSGLVKTGKAMPLYSFGILDEGGNIVRDPNFPEVTTFPEAYEIMHGKKPSGPGYEAWKALFQMGVMTNKVIFLPAGTPKPIVEAWRTAARKMLEDPQFKEQAAAIVEGYPQFIGEEAKPIMREATSLSPEVWDWLKTFLKTKHGVDM